MKSKSQIKTDFWADSHTLGVKRLNKPPAITKACKTGLSKIAIGDRPLMTYAVIDAFPLACNGNTFHAILCREADADMLSIPGVEPIACFAPVPGRGKYTMDNVRPSVLFWQDEFWIPLWLMEPEREEIAKHIYGDDIIKIHLFDVLHKVDVTKIPKVDLLKIKDE